MAEKYGSVPKKFTRAWWEYFWMYYKWHTIVIIVAILLTLLTIHQIRSVPKYDLTLTYGGKHYFSDESLQKFEATLSPLVDDIDENGEKSLRFSQITLSADEIDTEYASLMEAKLHLAIAEDETYIFILDRETASRYAGLGAFSPVDKWLDANISEENLFTDGGTAYGVSLTECGVFKDFGIMVDDHFLFIRYYPREDQIEKQLAGYKEAIRLANTVISPQ